MLHRPYNVALRCLATAVALLLVVQLGVLVRLTGPSAEVPRPGPGPAPRPGPVLRPGTAVELEGDPAAAMGIAATPTGLGYWVADADGRVTNLGDAPALGSAGPRLNQPIVGIAATPSGRGYRLVASDGGIFSFGDATFRGSTGAIRLNQPIVGIASTPSGRGYWLVASDGGIFSFGDATFYGSTGAIALNQPMVGMASTPSGRGYWLVASDGGIFTFGDATYHGSTGALAGHAPVSSMAPSVDGAGYWLVTTDGGVLGFGDARFSGSAGARAAYGPAVAMASTPHGAGYWLLAGNGDVQAFGDAVPAGTDLAPARSADRPVGTLTMSLVDPARSTPARGSVPGHQGRDLPTEVLFPAPAPGAPAPGGPFPVVVFAHGFNSSPIAYDALLRRWAAAGYVVAAPYLPGARSDTLGVPTRSDLGQEPVDISTVISAVLQVSASPGSPLEGLVDPGRVAVAGHSDGAIAVAALALGSAYHDGRVKTALVLAGAEVRLGGGSFGSTGNVPVLVVQGSADEVNAPADGYRVFADAGGPRVFVEAIGGSHMGAFIGRGALGDAVRASTVDFLDAELGGGRPALSRLAHDADTPGLTAPIFDLG